MVAPDEQPLSFERLPQAKFAGCLAYLLLIPVFAVVAALIVGLLVAGLWKLTGWKNETVPPLLMLAGFLGAIPFAIKGYLQRAGTRILVFSDRLEATEGMTPTVYRFDDLLWIEGPSLAFLSRPPASPLTGSLAVTLKRKDGRRLILRNEEWPLRDVSAALLDRAVPVQARTMSERLDSGETIEFRPGVLQSVRYLIVGSIGLALGGFWLFLGLKAMQEDKSYKSLALPILVVTSSLSALVMVGRAKGSLLMDRRGIRARRRDALLPWERIRDVQVLIDAMNITADDGSILRLGMLARNYDACRELVRRRRPAKT